MAPISLDPVLQIFEKLRMAHRFSLVTAHGCISGPAAVAGMTWVMVS